MLRDKRGIKRKRGAYTYKKRNSTARNLNDLKLQLSRWGTGIHQHQFKVQDTFTITFNGAATFTSKAWNFTLNQYNGAAGLQAVYDRYRLCWVKVECLPRQNSFDAANLTGAFFGCPSLVSVIDHDDDTAPTSYNSMLEYDNARVHQFDKPFKRIFKPSAAVAAYSGAFTSYASSTPDQWMDVASSDIRYYGFKVGSFPYSALSNGDSPVWDVIFTYYMEFTHTR